MVRFFACLVGFALSLGWPLTTGSASELRHDAIFSHALHRDIPLLVYLPDGYRTSGQKYSVVYLLHGAGDTENSWADRADIQDKVDKLISSGAMPPSIIVMPGCRGCWWVDSGTSKMETAFWSDLVPQVERRYRAVATREGRFLAGISAGGHGAIRFALKYPERISAVAALSPAIYHDAPPAASCSRQSGAFRDVQGRFNLGLWAAQNYPSLIEGYSKKSRPMPFYLVSGATDNLGIALETTVLFNALRDRQPELTRLNIVEGGHDWRVWAPALDDALRYLFRSTFMAHAGATKTQEPHG